MVLTAILIGALVQQVPPPEAAIIYAGTQSKVFWEHDGLDAGGSGLAGFDLEFFDAAGTVVLSDSVTADLREYPLSNVGEGTLGDLRVRARDAAGNVSNWTHLGQTVIIDRTAPNVVITIRVQAAN